ncbi:MAG: JAB domain-containing protein [Acholeplasmataceae bacterium]|nr:MAG: JAB domain-containing protein [Acholeplasmataceae bacterium]
MYMIKEMPVDARPRERMMQHGASALSNEELMAVLLRTGLKDLSVLELSKNVLYHLASLDDLKRLTLEEIMMVKGIKLAKAATVLAAIELGRRLSRLDHGQKTCLQSAHDVYHLLASEVAHLEQEHFMVLYLNTKSMLIRRETVFIGTINQTLIHPREIFKTAIRLSAAAVLFVHNHPSGDPTPSKADEAATKTLVACGELMGIDVIDHVIIGHHALYSLKEQKLISVRPSL